MPDNYSAARARIIRFAILRFGLWMVFAMFLFQSITVTIAWWEDPHGPRSWGDWLWIGALPALLWIYLRYFSRLGCRAGCQIDDTDTDAKSG